MSLKQDLLDALEALDPRTDETKAKQELDDAALALSSLLAQPQGLEFVEYLVKELDSGKKPFLSSNLFIERDKFEQLIEHHYNGGDIKSLNILLSLYHQIWIHKSESIAAKNTYAALRALENSVAIDSKDTIACFDLDSLQRIETVSLSHEANVLQIYKLSLSAGATSVLKHNHYLEIYVKMALKQGGIELLGWPINKHGDRAYTSVRYQVDGEKIEVDVHGITEPLALLLCEAKTSVKITLNDLRLIENTYDKLMRKVCETSRRQFASQKIFIITGEFDANIPRSARKNWELLDRSKILHLADEFKQIKNEI